MAADIRTAGIKIDLARFRADIVLSSLAPEHQGVGLSRQCQLDHLMGQGHTLTIRIQSRTIWIESPRIKNVTQVITLCRTRSRGHITTIGTEFKGMQLSRINTTEPFTQGSLSSG